ncbi:MAG: hypothetical protein K8T20_18770 [Planctomycetes bacterium]|nr:hypothetical protein [Planctomycetota bacterium]
MMHVVEMKDGKYLEIDHYIAGHVPCVVIAEKYLVYLAYADPSRKGGLYVYRDGIQPKLLTTDDITELQVLEERIEYKYMNHADGTYPMKSLRLEEVVKVAEAR